MAEKYKYLLFDADNTLFDFNASEVEAFCALNTMYPGMFIREYYDVYHRENKLVWEALERGELTRESVRTERFRNYMKKMNFTVTEGDINTISETYTIGLSFCSHLMENSMTVLRALAPEYELYIITNGISTVQRRRFESSPLRHLIKKMYVSEELGYNKPEREYFDIVINDIGDSDRRNYLVIGDSLTSDIDGAIESGIDCCFFSPEDKPVGDRRITYKIKSLTELIKLL